MKTTRAELHGVVHISAARRIGRSADVKTEPPCEVVPLLAAEVPERNRALLVEADIRADMNAGDPMGWALRKANYVLEAARGSFREDEHLDSVVRFAVEAIRDYGEESGAVLLRKAFLLHGTRPDARSSISEAAARIGGPDDFDIILSCLNSDIQSPEGHLRALSAFVERHPSQAGRVHDALCGLPEPGREVLEAMRSLSSRRGEDP